MQGAATTISDKLASSVLQKDENMFGNVKKQQGRPLLSSPHIPLVLLDLRCFLVFVEKLSDQPSVQGFPQGFPKNVGHNN